MDFTTDKYQELLKALNNHKKFKLRHDVDLRPEYALRIAQLESTAEVQATYYFRAMHFDSHAETIKAVVALGHTAGYHYENLATCHGDFEAAYSDFCQNLEKLRKIVPVNTACAHGSPSSPWNSQDIWSRYDIHSLGIDYEPMMDTDFSQTLYLTDTGRRWDGYKVSVRDKVPKYQDKWVAEGLVFHTTDDIMRALNNSTHPMHSYSLLVNTHPQRWMPFGVNWMIEASAQNIKNIAKMIIVCAKY